MKRTKLDDRILPVYTKGYVLSFVMMVMVYFQELFMGFL